MEFVLSNKKESMLFSILICGLVSVLIYVYRNNWWIKCRKQRNMLRKQGIDGPKASLMHGNVSEMQRIQAMVSKSPCLNSEMVAHDYTSTVFPYFEQWRKQYGPIYTYSTGDKQHLYVNDPNLVRDMSLNMSLGLGKPTYITKALAPLLGSGILRSNGHDWAKQRKVISPQFYMDKVKGMVGFMKEAIQPLLTKWEACIEEEGGSVAEVRVDEDFRATAGDMISRACFGTSHYKGKEIFLKLRTLQKLMSKQNFLFKVPTFSLVKTKVEKEVKSLEKEIETLIWEAVQESGNNSSEKNLMQWILDEAINDGDYGKDSSKQLVVDNCKNLYFAGHESTAVAASWCLMLLALHPEWQDRIRDEVSQHCKRGDDHELVIDADSLLKIKTVTMVIQETLRLYPPGAFISREAREDYKLGNIQIPKGVCVWTLIPTLHRNPDLWGQDANEFKPERFANGISNATKIPQTYIPFGLGGRVCLGKNFAMVELKLLLCLIISKFSFSLSPKYKHFPAYKMIVEPGNGVHILIKRI